MGSLPGKVLVAEVCPRDGWQNHPHIIPVERKIAYIKKMIDYGARRMDVTSFVNPKYVPQMEGARDVFLGIKDYAAAHGVQTTALALNARGAQDAIEAGFSHVQFVLSASEEHNLRNSRRTIQESMDAFKELARAAKGVEILLAVPCVFGSPFGDEIPLERIRWIIEEGLSVGVSEFGLADTAGLSTPDHTGEVLRAAKEYIGVDQISLHLHDTYGMGMANVYVGLQEGVANFDAALAGMGGCPFVPGAKGNIATEDLIYMLDRMGVESGYDLSAVNALAAEMAAEIRATVASCQGALYGRHAAGADTKE